MPIQLLKDLIIGVSEFGNQPIFVLFTILITALLLLHNKLTKDFLFLMLSSLSYPYSLILKEIFKIENPAREGMAMYFEGDKYTFPSSHVVFYTVFFGYIFFLTYLRNSKLSKQSKITLQILCLVMILFVGASRILLGYHSVLDVAAGYVFGSLYLALIIVLSNLENGNKIG